MKYGAAVMEATSAPCSAALAQGGAPDLDWLDLRWALQISNGVQVLPLLLLKDTLSQTNALHSFSFWFLSQVQLLGVDFLRGDYLFGVWGLDLDRVFWIVNASSRSYDLSLSFRVCFGSPPAVSKQVTISHLGYAKKIHSSDVRHVCFSGTGRWRARRTSALRPW